jgi:hypothetical protein
VSLAFDRGALYVADRDNNAVRRLELGTGAVTTLAVHVERPGAIAVMAGQLFTGDGRAVRRTALDGSDSEVLVAAGSGLRLGSEPLVNVPIGIAPIGAHDILVLDGVENSLLRFAR